MDIGTVVLIIFICFVVVPLVTILFIVVSPLYQEHGDKKQGDILSKLSFIAIFGIPKITDLFPSPPKKRVKGAHTKKVETSLQREILDELNKAKQKDVVSTIDLYSKSKNICHCKILLHPYLESVGGQLLIVHIGRFSFRYTYSGFFVKKWRIYN